MDHKRSPWLGVNDNAAIMGILDGRPSLRRNLVFDIFGIATSWTRVPYPVGVKNAGTPAPPALTRSAKVPWWDSQPSITALLSKLDSSFT